MRLTKGRKFLRTPEQTFFKVWSNFFLKNLAFGVGFPGHKGKNIRDAKIVCEIAVRVDAHKITKA